MEIQYSMKTAITFLCLSLLASPLFAATTNSGVNITNKPAASVVLDSDTVFTITRRFGTNQTVNTIISNLFSGRVLQWGSTGGEFRIRTNTATLPVLVLEFIDDNGVIVTNIFLRTNGIPFFPNGAGATLLDVGVQTVDELVMETAANGVAGINSTGKIVAVNGTAGNPLVARTGTPGFSNGVAVANLYGTGTGTGVTSPTNWYLNNLYVSNNADYLTSNNKTNQIDWSDHLAFFKRFTNATGIGTNVFLQLTNILDGQKMQVRIPGALGSTIASNYAVTVLAPSGYRIDWKSTTNGVNDFLVTSNKVGYVELTKWHGTNVIEADWRVTN